MGGRMPTIGRDTTISWLGHGTFHITTPAGKRLLMDAWVDSNPACPDAWKQRIQAEGLDAIFVTHGHADHTYDMLIVGDLYQPDLTILPIGDYFTMDPRQAAYALKLIRSKYAIPSHFGTFPILTGTPDELRRHAQEFGVNV